VSRAANSEANRKSVLALYALLHEVSSATNSVIVDDVLRSSLRTQGALARYFNPDKHIEPSSINSLKSHADLYLPGGFEALDRERRRCLKIASSKESAQVRGRRTPRERQSERFGLVTNELKQAREDLLLLTTLLERSLSAWRACAASSSDGRQTEHCERQQRVLLAMLSTRHQSS
jgi:hypothetical protein